jgi:hypothetical protein
MLFMLFVIDNLFRVKTSIKLIYTSCFLYQNLKNRVLYYVFIIIKADLDTFVHVNNLREFLKDKNPKAPITFGYDFKVIIDGGYHSGNVFIKILYFYQKLICTCLVVKGGAGYVLSKESFGRLGSTLSKNLTNCVIGDYEDTDVNLCLRKLGVNISKSIDHLGRERFHTNDLHSSFKYNSSKDDGWSANPVRGVCLFDY